VSTKKLTLDNVR